MLPRRHIRIKTFQTLYSHSQHIEKQDFNLNSEFEKNLKAYLNLYYFIIELLFLLKETATKQIKIKQKNLIPSNEDLNPNKKFINNQILKNIKLKNNKQFTDSEKLKKIVNIIFNKIKKTDSYINYMKIPNNQLEEDRNFILHILKTHFIKNQNIHDFIEDYSIYWNDDFIVSYNLLVEKIKNNDPLYKVQLFRNNDDKLYAKELLKKTIKNNDEINKIIKKIVLNWETERIALSDLILIKMAITEITYIENIPYKVSLDEYIEISKEYSTPKSNEFINGVLDVYIKSILPEKLTKE